MRSGNIDKSIINNKKIDADFERKDFKNSKKISKTRKIIVIFIWLILMILVYFQVYQMVQYTFGNGEKEKLVVYNQTCILLNKVLNTTSKTTTEEYSLKFAGLGDVYGGANTITGAKGTNGYEFSINSDEIKETLNSYDLVVASLNTPVAEKSLLYTSKEIYNTPKEILDMLKNLNVSVLATATSHAMDKKEKGLLQTITNIEEVKIEQTGINKEEGRKPVIITKNEIKIGILSYAINSNIKIEKTKSYLVNILNEENLKADIEKLKSENVDFIVTYLNTPNENNTILDSKQVESVEMLFENGVNVVLGTGSKVVQESLKDQIEIDSKKNQIYAVYSLGDFFGGCVNSENQVSMISNIDFSKKIIKNKEGEIVDTVKEFKVNNPTLLLTKVDKKYKRTVYNLDKLLKAYNEGDTSVLTTKEYASFNEIRTRILESYSK